MGSTLSGLGSTLSGLGSALIGLGSALSAKSLHFEHFVIAPRGFETKSSRGSRAYRGGWFQNCETQSLVFLPPVSSRSAPRSFKNQASRFYVYPPEVLCLPPGLCRFREIPLGFGVQEPGSGVAGLPYGVFQKARPSEKLRKATLQLWSLVLELRSLTQR